ncbi:hypothetical protein [Streptomyces tendae]|uniref:hypothetical protein n=1 Tax=Streptomyces tendae TaxID=1932 RepID=UPI002492AC0E|nr:hypothetical protein [Streptomyces tendae]
MSGDDPHVHVVAKVPSDDAAVRTVLAAAFGLAGDLPGVVTTGCGLRAPYAATSARPDRVTCLPCREHARREHLRFADEAERLSGMPGSTISPAQGRSASAHHRDLARRFAEA